MSLSALLTALSADPGERGRQFEHLCRWFLETAPEYRGRLGRIWLWRDWPGAWGPDAGIDLVAEDREGGFWAIQAKCYDENHTISKAEIDSFLSESSRPEFVYRLLIATTDRVGATARRTLAAQEKPVGLLLRSQLEVAEINWPHDTDALAPLAAAPKAPMPHQEEAITAVLDGFARHDRGQLLMACGTGKTLTARWIAERLNVRRALVLVPSLSLLGQTLRVWMADADHRSYIAVCSDETVPRDEADAIISSATELGLPVTTDPARIASFLSGEGTGDRVVFSTYQSSEAVALAQAACGAAFDLVIADEAHRCAGPLAGPFATVLDGKRILAEKRLFMTATPRYFTGRLRREAAEADFEVASMDDEERFGRVFHRLSFGEAIARELLSDYQVAVVGVTDSEYRELAERAAFVTLDGRTSTDARTLAAQVGLAKAIRKYDLRRVVSFHGRINRAARFAAEMGDVVAWLPVDERPVGIVRAEHVSGRMSAGLRERKLRRLRDLDRDEHALLTNARCLGEGVDVPTLDGIAFIDPRSSQIDIIQAVGRAIRKAPDKKVGTIVLPVLVGDRDDADAVLSASAFKPVWDVLRALRAHDEVLADELDALRRQQGRQGLVGQRPTKIQLDLPEGIGVDFTEAFDARLLEATTASWELWFGLLVAYVEHHGDCLPPAKYLEQGLPLGRWVDKQRAAFKRGDLSPERAARLQALPGWAWSVLDGAWEQAFAALVRFRAEEGSTRVPVAYEQDGVKLGRWVIKQRQAYRHGRLSVERVQRLEAIEGWAWMPRDAAWEHAYSLLERYVAREGNSRVPDGHVEEGFHLGAWLGIQRRLRRRGRLDPVRAFRIEQLPGWSWDPVDEAWNTNYQRLIAYAERHGHARVPVDYVEDDVRLGWWAKTQRSFFLAGRLDPALAARLTALPGWDWHRHQTGWERGYDALLRYVDQHGKARLPGSCVQDGFRLGQWVQNRRNEYRRGKLSAERVAKLEALPGWSWSRRTISK